MRLGAGCLAGACTGLTGVSQTFSFPVKDRLLRELITGLTDTPDSVPGGFLGWQEVETQLADMGLSCTRLFRVLGAAGSPGNSDLAGDCEDQLLTAA